jgi:hypoxanthine phosphoribosyltransferase
MKKIYISAQSLLKDSFLIGKQIIESDFKPNFIVGVWRGGTPVGIAVQEMLAFFGQKSDHIAVRTSLYRGLDKRNDRVRVHGMDYLITNMNNDDSLLIVDDVFDTGRSIDAIFHALKSKMRRNCPAEIRVATPWFKPNKNATSRVPDYYVHETDDWLVFPHVLDGLSVEEIKSGKGELVEIMQSVECVKNPLFESS